MYIYIILHIAMQHDTFNPCNTTRHIRGDTTYTSHIYTLNIYMDTRVPKSDRYEFNNDKKILADICGQAHE